MFSWLARRRANSNKVGDTGDDMPSSVTSSSSSLTPSETEQAIMSMFSAGQGDTRDALCTVNPITPSGKRKQLCLTLSVVAIPLMILIGMTANTFGVTLHGYMDGKGIRKVLRFSTELGSLIHNIQKERDASALYLYNSLRLASKEALLESYIDTDNVLKGLSYWPSINVTGAPEFESWKKYLIYLYQHRYQLDTINHTVTQELMFYTGEINVFLDWLYDSITEARSGTVWRSLVAFLEITDAKISFGIERALGAIFYARGSFPTMDDYLWFSERQDIANASFLSARRFSDVAAAIYDELIAKNDTVLRTMEYMRQDIRQYELSNRKGSFEKAEYWMEIVTSYLQVLLDTQLAVLDSILEELDDREQEDLNKMIIIACVFLVVLLVCPFIVNGVYKLTTEMQRYSITLVNRTNALQKEKKRTDALLYQMLPKSVANQLKANKEVAVEMFSDVTIFFSDIVDFTRISAQCSPVQVINMLNSLFCLCDERLKQYDVYKVETIGDAYMVASGLPTPNGKRHASEIAKLALDLVSDVSGLDIPHLPGTRFKLRIGIHTGQVLAGVVGIKMPRYCLFGETVTIANKMESLGLPGRIHISQMTYDNLAELGGFLMETRQDNTVKVKKDLALCCALKGNVRTYWLMGQAATPKDFGAIPSTSTAAESDIDDFRYWPKFY